MSAAELQLLLSEVAERARSVDVRRFEEGGAEEVTSTLLPAIENVVRDGLEALGRALAHYEAPREDDAPDESQPTAVTFYQGIEDLMIRAAGAAKIAELAFMARWELERKTQALRALGGERDHWKIIAECGSSRRRLIKSLTAVEMALCEHESLKSRLESSYVSELKRALETRRTYALFRRHLRKARPLREESIQKCLRAGGTAIATIIGRDVYDDLRVSDRIQLRRIQTRILEWLRGADAFDSDSGRRIWQDLEACADIFLQVNHRTELCEHDARIVEDALRLVDSEHRPSEEVRSRLVSLLGRDEELDELIEGGPTVDPRPLVELLRRLNRGFGRSSGGSSDDPSSSFEMLMSGRM
jgi:hypothetical protein